MCFCGVRGEGLCGSAPPPHGGDLEVALNNALDDDDGLLTVRTWHGWPVNTPMTQTLPFDNITRLLFIGV